MTLSLSLSLFRSFFFLSWRFSVVFFVVEMDYPFVSPSSPKYYIQFYVNRNILARSTWSFPECLCPVKPSLSLSLASALSGLPPLIHQSHLLLLLRCLVRNTINIFFYVACVQYHIVPRNNAGLSFIEVNFQSVVVKRSGAKPFRPLLTLLLLFFSCVMRI